MRKRLISIAIPCFNEEENVVQAYKTLTAVTDKIRRYAFEFIYVDNGSSDKTRIKITSCKKDRRVRGIYLSRNFGNEASIKASLDHTTGDAVILYFCDMQEPASMIPVFINKWENGFDNVVAVYTKTEDSLIVSKFRQLYYQIFQKLSYIDIPVQSHGFGLMGRNVLNAINTIPDRFRFFRGLRAWVGFRTTYVLYKRLARLHGKSTYGFWNYIQYAQNSFFGFSYLPLDFLIYIGFFLTTLSFLFIIGYLMYFFLYGNPIKGAVTIIVAIVFFGGVNMLALSIIGKYIQVIVEETKNRPTYIVEEMEGFK
jgi:dolichol-phosphate mannosyltransferase